MRHLDRDGLGRLLELLVGQGYEVVGPTVRDGASHDPIDGVGPAARVREVQ
jgi:hypothetical protein